MPRIPDGLHKFPDLHPTFPDPRNDLDLRTARHSYNNIWWWSGGAWRDVTSTDDDLLILTSMVILRGDTHHVAKVTMKTPAEALLDLNNTHVTGSITGTSGLRGRLHMTVDFPTR